MFTGIIEVTGVVSSIKKEQDNLNFEVQSPISDQLVINQSVAHNGVCLSVTQISDGKHWVTAVSETLSKTALQHWKIGDVINLERSLTLQSRLDGHIVQGHVDQVAICSNKMFKHGSWLCHFEYDSSEKYRMIEKGSICVDGVSLTCFDVAPGKFNVAIIPYTYEHTHFKNLKKGDYVNLEFDVLGKYVQALMENK